MYFGLEIQSLLLEKFAELKTKVHTYWWIWANTIKSYRCRRVSVLGLGKVAQDFYKSLYQTVVTKPLHFLPATCKINWHRAPPLKTLQNYTINKNIPRQFLIENLVSVWVKFLFSKLSEHQESIIAEISDKVIDKIRLITATSKSQIYMQ